MREPRGAPQNPRCWGGGPSHPRCQSHCAPDFGEPGGARSPAEVRGREASGGGGRAGAPLTHPVLDLGRKPVGGPLVELRGAHAGDGTARDRRTDGPTAGRARGRQRAGPAPPPPLIGPRRTCPYKAATRRIPAAADFLSPRGRRGPPSPAERPIPAGPQGH